MSPPEFYPPHPARATRNWTPRDEFELKLKKDQKIFILTEEGPWWYTARTADGKEGYVSPHIVSLDKNHRGSEIQGSSEPPRYTKGSMFEKWVGKAEKAFNAPMSSLDEFPTLPKEIIQKHSQKGCQIVACRVLKYGLAERPGTEAVEGVAIRACQHDIIALLNSGGDDAWGWGVENHKKFHPDWFGRRCKESFKEKGSEMASELFVLMGQVCDDRFG
ncbi:hypothetical protein P152DRAFT_458750 [Eremomyces bilateralis CBS 781.70]|uniref:SH3 domain-containing protein n=1 Tax=Eremomyces bilateralis CBS 781.70 TaxID=1392243 RepID=A0A6G1G2P2_9PEZI|nr:uncharacterized protein P152DRAFT_458750 [Eremomyces bilateralis CBS 781.70]KAF1812375.1 hypothetical protein P152DRAFT_458750 [Eremomyces bilateralis CBS 781.70]